MTDKITNLIASLNGLVDRLQANIGTKLDATGVAAAAIKLETPRAFYISGDGAASGSFDGTSSVTLNMALKNSGVTAGAYGSQDRIPIVTVNNKGIVTDVSTITPRRTVVPVASVGVLPAQGEVDVIYMVKSGGSTLLYRWNGAAYENMTATLTMATSAERLTTARQFTFVGDMSGNVMFDGSSDVSITVELPNTAVTPGEYAKVTVDAKGRVISGMGLRTTDIPQLDQDTTGNAGTASALQTGRFITLNGDVSGTVAFDGTSDVSLTAVVADNSHAHTMSNVTGLSAALAILASLTSPAFAGIPTAPTAAAGTNTSQLATCAFVKTEVGSLAPSKVGLGASGTWGIGITGNAATASKLATARNLSISGDASGTTTYDGSGDSNTILTLSNTAVNPGSYGNNASTLQATVDAKGRVTGLSAVAIRQATLVLPGIVQLIDSVSDTTITAAATPNAVKQAYDIAAAAIPMSLKGANNGVAELDASGLVKSSQLPSYVDDVLEFAIQGAFPATGESGKIYVALDSGRIYRWTGSQYIEISAVVGNSDSATKLATARTIAVSGDGAGSVSFDGSANVNISLVLANTGVAAATYNASPVGHTPFTVDAKGRITAVGNDVLITPAWSSITGKPTTINGFGITDALLLGSTVGVAPGVAAAGTANTAAHSDHVHPIQTTITGNAATASKLANSVTINGTPFDGSASITIVDPTKEPAIAAGAAGSFWNGVKAWSDFATSVRNSALTGLSVSTTTAVVATDTVLGAVGKLQGQINAVATNNSPALTGIPTAPTAAVNTNTAQLATCEFTIAQIADDAPTKTGGGANGNWNINVTGTAAKLTTPRALSWTGDATGTLNFDGSVAVSAALTLANSGVIAATYNSATQLSSMTVDVKGRVTSMGAPVTITPAWGSITGKPTTAAGFGITDAELAANKGVANGYAGLDANGKVPSTQLPSYVDDVLEYATQSIFPATGEAGKIYIDLATNKTYRWSGTVYVEISASPGTTDSVVEGTTNLYFTAARAQAAVTTITGNAATASKWLTARNINLTGDASGTASFDGSANVGLSVALAVSGVTAGTYNATSTTHTPFTVDAKGRVTATGAELLITPAFASITAKPTTLAGYGITDSLVLSAVAPVALGAAAVGVATTAARADHVHPLQTSVSGNAATATLADSATKLANPRGIGLSGDASGSVNFDGSAAVNIPMVLANSGVAAGSYPKVTVDSKGRVTAGLALIPTDVPVLNQDTTGTAALATLATAATKLASARAISLTGDTTGTVNFDGSAAVSITTTLANSGVTAGTYNNSATMVTPLTVDVKGRVTGAGAALLITPAWTSITGKPTTLAGFGITDGLATSGGALTSALSGTCFKATGGIPASGTTGHAFAGDDDTGMFGISAGVGGLFADAVEVARFSSTELTINLPVVRTTNSGKARWLSQDGSGRQHWYWNTAGGTAPLLEVAGEGASDIMHHADSLGGEYFAYRAASGAGKAAGSPIVWEDVLMATRAGVFTFKGSDVITAANFTATIPASGVTAGTYSKVTVDAKGRVTAGAALLAADIPTLNQNTTGNAATATAVAFTGITGKPTTVATSGLTDAESTTKKGVANGYAGLDGTGKVPASQLPSYVDDVLEFATKTAFPATGETAKLYVDVSTSNVWRWSGTVYVEIASSPGSSDSVVEGTTNLYFTAARAQAAVTTITGNAATATKLATARAISLTGDATGTVNFDGSAAAPITVVLAASGVTAGKYNDIATAVEPFTVDAKGRVTLIGAPVTITPAWGSITAKPTTVAGYGITDALALSSALPAAIGTAAVGVGTTAARADHVHQAQTSITGNAGSATVLDTARTINGIAFDGSANIVVPPIGATYQSTARVNVLNGAAAQGMNLGSLLISDAYADVTNVPINGVWVKGNVTTAGIFTGNGSGLTTLNAANLSSGIIPDARISGTYTGVSITGNAATATTLQTARTINGVSFNGSANIVVADATKEPAIAAGTLAQFWSGSKTWVNFDSEVRACPLTGLTLTNADIVATDTVIVGLGKAQAQLNVLAPLASPSFTGVPLAPTAAVNTNTTQLATCAFTRAEIGSLAPTKVGVGASGTWAIAITGNAASATVLDTARKINGVAFDGSANITVADATKLPLTGGILTGLLSTDNCTIAVGAATATDAFRVLSISTAPAVMTFLRSGSYGVNMGLDADNVFRLGGYSDGASVYRWSSDTVGTFTARGNVAAYSDIRLKTDIKVIPNALDKLCTLRGVTYTRTDTGQVQAGVIAQEVQAVLPEVVQVGDDEMLTVAYGNMGGLYIEAIKDLVNMVNDLKAEVAELRSMV